MQEGCKNESGGALVEFALFVPALLLICLGMFEVRQYMYIHAKLDDIVYKIADWTASAASQSKINDYIIGAWNMGRDINFAQKGTVYVTGVLNNGAANKAVWTVCSAGATTAYGGLNATVILPSPLVLPSNHPLIIVEVNYAYTPVTNYISFLTSSTLSKVFFVAPRGTATFNPLPA